MTLSTVIFVFGFLPVFLLIYYVSKDNIKKYILLAASIYFYYATETFRIRYVILLCLFVYFITFLMDKFSEKKKRFRKALFICGIGGTVCLLFYYRYLNFFFGLFGTTFGVTVWQKQTKGVPLGLSFITFAIISYIADCYGGKVKIQKNPFKLATYILMFPKVIMGPIERYTNLEANIEHPDVSMSNVGIGMSRFMIGFCKKMIIADNLAVLVNQIESGNDFSTVPITLLWLGSIGFSLELYFDFSGYSDMAIGIAQMLGYHYKENFNYPYSAGSVTDFWHRWHISLSSWFKDYVYIPMGGSRRSLFRNILNLFIVWLLTGLWHGASFAFILWGLVYFVFLLIERYIVRLKQRNDVVKLIWRIVTLLVINFNWVIFNIPSWKSGINYCKAMLGWYNNPITSNVFVKDIREYYIYLLLGVLLSTPVFSRLAEKIRIRDKFGMTAIIYPLVLIGIFIWALSFSMLGVNNPFIYQQF